jgi:hypothetical protein
VQLLGAVVDIHQKQIVQQKILDEIVLVEPFLICGQKAGKLESRHLSHHIYIIAGPLCQQNIFQLVLVKYFKKLVAVDHLTVRRRSDKGRHLTAAVLRLLFRRSQNLPFHIQDAQINPGNFPQSIDRVLKYLV